MRSGYQERSRQVNHGAPGVSGAPADVKCRSPEEDAPGQSLFGGGVPGRGQRTVPAALRHVVGAATDRISRSRVSAECRADHHRDGVASLKELAPMKKDQVDLQNAVVWIPDSKTPNGVAEVPLTPLASKPFVARWPSRGESPYLFPSDQNRIGHQTTFKTVWHKTLRRAKIPYFRIYDLRSTYATRLSAGGVADEWVTQMLRQGDAKVFKKYSQMKLQMKREALEKINRRANEKRQGFGSRMTVTVQKGYLAQLWHGFGWKGDRSRIMKFESALESRQQVMSGRSAAW